MYKLFEAVYKLFATVYKLFVTGYKLFAAVYKLFATVYKLFAMVYKLFATVYKLFTAGGKLFAAVYTNLLREVQVIYGEGQVVSAGNNCSGFSDVLPEPPYRATVRVVENRPY